MAKFELGPSAWSTDHKKSSTPARLAELNRLRIELVMLERKNKKHSLLVLPALMVGLALVLSHLFTWLEWWFAAEGAALIIWAWLVLIFVEKWERRIEQIKRDIEHLASPTVTAEIWTQRHLDRPSLKQMDENRKGELRSQAELRRVDRTREGDE